MHGLGSWEFCKTTPHNLKSGISDPYILFYNPNISLSPKGSNIWGFSHPSPSPVAQQQGHVLIQLGAAPFHVSAKMQ